MDIYPVVFQGRRLAIIYTVHVLLYEEYRGHIGHVHRNGNGACP